MVNVVAAKWKQVILVMIKPDWLLCDLVTSVLCVVWVQSKMTPLDVCRMGTKQYDST